MSSTLTSSVHATCNHSQKVSRKDLQLSKACLLKVIKAFTTSLLCHYDSYWLTEKVLKQLQRRYEDVTRLSSCLSTSEVSFKTKAKPEAQAVPSLGSGAPLLSLGPLTILYSLTSPSPNGLCMCMCIGQWGEREMQYLPMHFSFDVSCNGIDTPLRLLSIIQLVRPTIIPGLFIICVIHIMLATCVTHTLLSVQILP